LTYILRRMLLAVPVMFGVLVLTFAIIQVTPGDPARLMLGERATQEQISRLREQLGLNDPVLVQFGRYAVNAVQGNLGESFRGQQPVARLIAERFPSTLELTLAAVAFAATVGIATGVFAATARRRWADNAVMLVALVGLSIPDFWLATLFVLLFGVTLGWVSVTGGEGAQNLILPALALGLGPAAVLARLTRSSVLEVLREDYVRTAVAKGAGRAAVVWRHTVRNALIPVVTVMGLTFAGMLGGAVFVESVFSRPGLGTLAIASVQARDFPVIQGMVLFLALIYVLVNLAVDLSYAVLNPRIGYA
jgi:ABC-type dipeptide/oligopeptide/nickel transport system permease component